MSDHLKGKPTGTMEGQWLISMVIGTPKRASSKIPPKLVTQPSDVVVFEGPFDKAPRTSKFKSVKVTIRDYAQTLNADSCT